MSILICPECKGKVSDRLENCPHCGYPIKELMFSDDRHYTIVNGVKYDVTEIVDLILSNNSKNLDKAGEIIRSNMDISPVKFIKPVYELKSAPKEINCKTLTEFKQEQQKNQELKPKCPTCNSTNIRKISHVKKTVGALSFGLLSKTARSQFECVNCGYKW